MNTLEKLEKQLLDYGVNLLVNYKAELKEAAFEEMKNENYAKAQIILDELKSIDNITGVRVEYISESNDEQPKEEVKKPVKEGNKSNLPNRAMVDNLGLVDLSGCKTMEEVYTSIIKFIANQVICGFNIVYNMMNIKCSTATLSQSKREERLKEFMNNVLIDLELEVSMLY